MVETKPLDENYVLIFSRGELMYDSRKPRLPVNLEWLDELFQTEKVGSND